MHRRSFLKAGSAVALAAGFPTEPLWACLRRDLRTGKRQCLCWLKQVANDVVLFAA